jgi:hypothetical protein
MKQLNTSSVASHDIIMSRLMDALNIKDIEDLK